MGSVRLSADTTPGGDVHGSPQELTREITRLKAELEELRGYREMAYRDALTGLRNRRYFEVRLAEELQRGQRGLSHHLSIVMVDLDDLKLVNDSLGHNAGDRALTWAAGFLVRELRQHDICCRLGGDEFVLLLPGTDTIGREQLVNRIREKLQDQDVTPEITVRLSLGGATWPMDGTTREELVAEADSAMYRCKLRQKGGVRRPVGARGGLG